MKMFTLSIIVTISFVIILSCSLTRPKSIGLINNRLTDCPDTPNCVNTYSSDSIHAIEPLHYTTTKEEAVAQIIEIINSMKRTKIITQTDSYLHVEFTTKIMRYTDDVEFYFDGTNKTIHFRSASRVGYSDLGLNRERMNEIKNIFKSLKK